VEDQNDFSVYKYKDSTGMVRQLARDSVFIMKNNDGPMSAMTAVYDCGSSGAGKVPLVCFANASQISTMPAVGLTTEAISNSQFGRIMMVGLLENVNTSLWKEGNILYVSDIVAGGLTNITPVAPHLSQEVGVVLVSHATLGKIQVISRNVEGNEYGTIANIWKLGDGLAGTKKLMFYNTFLGNLSWNPTANREIIIPDANGTMALTSSLTGNYSVGNCWIYFIGGIANSTNCTGI
jgi:hypothetical protein